MHVIIGGRIVFVRTVVCTLQYIMKKITWSFVQSIASVCKARSQGYGFKPCFVFFKNFIPWSFFRKGNKARYLKTTENSDQYRFAHAQFERIAVVWASFIVKNMPRLQF